MEKAYSFLKFIHKAMASIHKNIEWAGGGLFINGNNEKIFFKIQRCNCPLPCLLIVNPATRVVLTIVLKWERSLDPSNEYVADPTTIVT